MKSVLIALFCCLFFTSFYAHSKVSIVSYNVHNLFDTEHDAGKIDFEYMPNDKSTCEKVELELKQECQKNITRTDWTKEKLQNKIQTIKDALMSNNGSLPDLLALQEVENENVVSMLAKELGYKNIEMTESKDLRGIDVALLFNETKDLVFEKAKTHEVRDLALTRPTRDILEVQFEYREQPLIVFVNHWPSQGNVSATRVAAAKKVLKRIARLQLFKKKNIVVTGDFNVIDSDFPHPFKSVLLTGKGRNELLDVGAEVRKHLSYNDRDAMPFGTYFYKYGLTWNRLDRFFISSELTDKEGLEADLKSFKIVSNPKITSQYEFKKDGHYLKGTIVKNIPAPFNHKESDVEKVGYSDHFPIYLELKFKGENDE